MECLRYIFVWLGRIGYCRGFGIQSPSDYWLVRYVFNEHWPYYQYENLGNHDTWLRKKLGRLYFRIANWRQPAVIDSDDYHEYFQHGCRNAVFGVSNELVRIKLEKMHNSLPTLLDLVNDDTVLIIEGIKKDVDFWHELQADIRVRVTFDLYYCGIVLFDKKRQKQNYIINF